MNDLSHILRDFNFYYNELNDDNFNDIKPKNKQRLRKRNLKKLNFLFKFIILNIFRDFTFIY